MSDPELLPCPFCGSKDLDYDGDGGFIVCNGKDCGVFGPNPDDRVSSDLSAADEDEVHATAVRKWNTRAPALPDEFMCELGQDGPCPNPAVYETWYRRRDPLLGTPSGHLVKVCICEEHKTHPFLCANEPKPKKETEVQDAEDQAG